MELVNAKNDYQTEGAAIANIFCACTTCTLVFLIAKRGESELSLGSTMGAESTAMPIGVGDEGFCEEAELLGATTGRGLVDGAESFEMV